jgi:hypothetical protein
MDLVRSLKEMIGELIVARIPVLNKDDMVFVLLHKVEASGIWVQSHSFNQDLLEKHDTAVSTTTLLLFVPYTSIDYIVASIEGIVLSEAALGLKE